MPANQLDTPVVLIIFNRPDTTARVFAEIAKARPRKLFVVGDGARDGRPEEHVRVMAARQILEQVSWDCEVLTDLSEKNLGCKTRISSGLDWVFGQVEKAIILEDDCLPHPSMFRFCEEMLQFYRDDERVMMIGGTNYLQDKLDLGASYFFSRYFAIWGWATWRRAWKKYDIGMQQWEQLRSKRQINAFYCRDSMRRHVAAMFDQAALGKVDTWDIQWFYSCLFNNGLSVVPSVNLISNIGSEGTHTSTDTRNNFLPLFEIDTANLIHPALVHPNYEYDDRIFASRVAPNVVMQLPSMLARARRNLLRRVRDMRAWQ